MGWKDKVNFEQLVLFCDIYRTTFEIQKEFTMTPIEAWHCVRWASKFKDDFLVEQQSGATRRAIWLKATPLAYNYYKSLE